MRCLGVWRSRSFTSFWWFFLQDVPPASRQDFTLGITLLLPPSSFHLGISSKKLIAHYQMHINTVFPKSTCKLPYDYLNSNLSTLVSIWTIIPSLLPSLGLPTFLGLPLEPKSLRPALAIQGDPISKNKKNQNVFPSSYNSMLTFDCLTSSVAEMTV
jgi:hypothetical protein